ncbi:SLBB domain-containing protein [Deferribacteraceae bacterium V6Fe1]|nr:SLBB domain-containing protein [Deferribacteraceae bacterium V6Fe1]
MNSKNSTSKSTIADKNKNIQFKGVYDKDNISIISESYDNTTYESNNITNPFKVLEKRAGINYKSFQLQVGDTVTLEYFRNNNILESHKILVNSTKVYIPFIGEINVDEYKNLSDLQLSLSEKLKSQNINLFIKDIRPGIISVGVFGDVLTPRFFNIERTSTLFDVIGQAGGVNNLENVQTIYIYRNNTIYEKINYNSLLKGDFKTAVLKDGDIVFVQNKLEKVNIEKNRNYEVSFDNLTIFGAEIFKFDFTGQIPDQNVNVDDDYVVGAGDTLNIYLWGRMTKTYNVPVENDGTIFINEIGKVQVSGKKLKEVKEILKGYLNSIEGVKSDVSIGSLKTIRVLVVGEVNNPGFQSISNLSTVTTAIAKAGGITNIADIRDVVVKRSGKVVATIDYYDFILKGDTNSDIYLQPNDVIFIPRSDKMVYLAGSVKNPAIYTLKKDEPLSTVIKFAGGLTPDGYSKQIHIKRLYNDKPSEVYDVSLDKANSFYLKDGDKVFVASITKPSEDSVFLYGEVYFPGRYSIKNTKKLLDIVKDKSNLKPEASLNYGYIKRLNRETKEYFIIPFNLEEAFGNPEGNQNIELKPLDEVYVVNRFEIMPKNIVEIKGEVQNPGRFEIEDKVTLYDAINKAGGLTTDASKDYIEIIRKGDGKFFTRFVPYESSKEFYLKVDDKVIVHSIWEKNLKKYVKIEGEVQNPGTYLLTENMTISDLIVKAGGLTKDVYMDVFHIYRLNETDFNYRLMTLDLKKDTAFKLSDRDEVVIHNFREFHPVQTVQILGEVNKPGVYNYAENMTLYDLVIAAGNMKDSAYLDRVEIVRMKTESGKTEYSVIDVNMNDILENKNIVTLRPYDVVNVRKISDFKREDKVVVTGEVYFPGDFVIRKGEKLADVILRAGGITEYGYIKNIIFKRKSVKEIQTKRLKELKDRLQATLLTSSSQEIAASLSPEDIAAQKNLQANLQQIVENLDTVEPEGRVVIKVDSFEQLANSQYNFILEDGDEIIIPKKPSTVNVVGEVYNATSFAFTDKEPTVEYFINACGGMTELASEDDIFVVRGDGSVISNRFIKKNYWWKDIYDVKLEAGDTVVIPRKLVFPNYMRDIKDITQILYQIATTVAVTKVLF